MTKGLFALLLAGTLTVPLTTPAFGNEAKAASSFRELNKPQAGAWAAVPLPPVPHLETMPWLTSGSLLRGPKVDMLIGPKFETLGPFLVGTAGPPRQFSSIAAPTEPQTE